MNRRLGLAVVAVAVAGLAGCKDARANKGGTQVVSQAAGGTRLPNETALLPKAKAGPPTLAGLKAASLEASRVQLAAIDEVIAVLNRFQDDATAAAALPDLRKAAARLKAASQRMVDLQKDYPNLDPALADQLLNDPEIAQQINTVWDAAGRMLDAEFNAQTRAPKYSKEIQAICESANVYPEGQGPPKAPRGRPKTPGKK